MLLRFAVQDCGIGISPAQLEMLFNPFTQADASTTRRFGGTGLGLSICKGLVEKMDGRIWVESEPGRGSTFYFTAKFLTGAVTPPDKPDAGDRREKLEQQMQQLRGACVLLVEDNAFNQQVLSEMLTEIGLVVDIAENGQAAINRLGQASYDAVLMDIQMPVMDGYTACARIRQNPHYQHLPIIALTANVSQAEKDRCREVGMNDHLAKPIEPERLFASLLKWVAPGFPDNTPEAGQPVVPVQAELPSFPGINAGPVIQRMRGNVLAYRRLLGIFCQQFRDSAGVLREALDAGDFETARRLAHTVKGSAGTIGAEVLSSLSAQLEHECKQSTPEYAALLDEFETALQTLLAGQE